MITPFSIFTMALFTEIVPPQGPVQYDANSTFRILFQLKGSVWSKVLPYCIANVILMIFIRKLRDYGIADMGMNNQGHTFAGMVVAFLLVSRINTTIKNYGAGRASVGTMYRETRELVYNSMVLSKRGKNNDKASKEWRVELAYRAILLLRTAVAAVEYDADKIPSWDVYELSGAELDYCQPSPAWKKYKLTPNNERSDTMKVPHRMAYLLRQTIANQSTRLEDPMHFSKENKMLNSVDTFLTGYYGLRKRMTTPPPFPLVQMTLILVLSYVFTIPFVLLNDRTDVLYEHCIVVFLITFGFLGLEQVAAELDDPFGNDDNDFDVRAFAKVVYEDILILVHDEDGEQYADMLKSKLMACQPKTDAKPNEYTSLMNCV